MFDIQEFLKFSHCFVHILSFQVLPVLLKLSKIIDMCIVLSDDLIYPRSHELTLLGGKNSNEQFFWFKNFWKFVIAGSTFFVYKNGKKNKFPENIVDLHDFLPSIKMIV